MSRLKYCYTFASQSRIKHKYLMTMKNILSKTKAVKNGMVANANVQSKKRMNGYLTKQQKRQKSIEAEAASRR